MAHRPWIAPRANLPGDLGDWILASGLVSLLPTHHKPVNDAMTSFIWQPRILILDHLRKSIQPCIHRPRTPIDFAPNCVVVKHYKRLESLFTKLVSNPNLVGFGDVDVRDHHHRPAQLYLLLVHFRSFCPADLLFERLPVTFWPIAVGETAEEKAKQLGGSFPTKCRCDGGMNRNPL